MKSTTKRKLGAVGLRTLGLASAVGIPAAVVLQKFPIWRAEQTVDKRALGMGGILIIIIALIRFRHKIWPVIKNRFWPYIKKKFHLHSIGPLIFWGALFGILLWLENSIPSIVLWLENIMDTTRDLRTVCTSCFMGVAVGQIADTAAGFVDPAKGEPEKEKAKEVDKDA